MSDTRREWNHEPDLPLQVSPLWQWPPKPLHVFKWYAGAWFFFTINMAILGLAFGSYFWLSPQLDQTLMWDFSWVSLIFLRNFVLFVIVAGGLHLWFHTYAVQGQDKKYDPRPFPRKGRMFSFNSQVLDNMFWSLASGVTIWSGFEVLLWWALSNGFAPLTTFAQTPVWFIAFFFFVPVWESFYFYWIHRLLHSNLLYRFHALHHRNTDVGPWSGLSMHPLEHLMFFGTVAIHFVLPTHPVHVIFHLMYYALYAVTTHTGFEGLWFRNLKRVHLGMFHHQIHHRYFEVNYGSLDVPWDKVFGSFHDGTPEGKARMKERLRSRKR
ncbi:sterol desaturase family protein [Sulfitobacter mediterraneus]|uniref:sterol desaturase family protein n=1 Tax=Sulfitobacter mediterraneus TaxID=83219 RepID=UPI001932114A|nr:sterol desaturase family protein [Sulfitobacter mediterraneus]MBM1310329.1 sterol desaturase family protein [Sulfitobacter mediterraneus]MBM1314213.1 sterol desaturase family protein [Sulfitobacter mediterraneus]MBM1322573.1 sterol desaturase family protein [Sulfitobacter mediterraneus]MBM1326485.1 sterol desaturase family protein [Sulfitobacter mediterraneus]MBM1397831.1 sterol desaturase family protein [Sulfitobacter mediterraneus]